MFMLIHESQFRVRYHRPFYRSLLLSRRFTSQITFLSSNIFQKSNDPQESERFYHQRPDNVKIEFDDKINILQDG